MDKEIVLVTDYCYKLGATPTMIYRYIREGKIDKLPCVLRLVPVRGSKVPMLEVDKELMYEATSMARSGYKFGNINKEMIKRDVATNRDEILERNMKRAMGEIRDLFGWMGDVRKKHFESAERKFLRFEDDFNNLIAMWRKDIVL